MKLPSLKETISGIAVAGVDLVAHKIDADQGFKKPFQNVTDIYRLGAVLGGMVLYSVKGSVYGLVLYDNALPLLTESVAYAAGSLMGKKLPGAPTADPLNPVNPQPVSQTASVQVVRAAPVSTLNKV